MIFNLVEWWQKRWRKKQRELDIKILWPAMKEAAALRRSTDPLLTARRLFVSHAATSEIWTADYTDEELGAFVLSLE